MPNRKQYPLTVRRPGAEAGVSLRKRRTWYAEGEGDGTDRDGQDGQGNGQQGGGSVDLDPKWKPENLERAETIIASLLKRLDERDAAYEQLKTQTDQRLTAIERDRTKKLEEEGNYKALLDQATAENEELKSYKDRSSALEQVIREGNETLIQRIAEDKRGIVPKEYPPEKLRTWLDDNIPLLTQPPAPDYDAGAGGNNGKGSADDDKVQVTEQDRLAAAIAQNAGQKQVSAEGIAKRRQEQGNET